VKKLVIFPEYLTHVDESTFKEWFNAEDMQTHINTYYRLFSDLCIDQEELFTTRASLNYLWRALGNLPNLQTIAFTDAQSFRPQINGWGPVSSTRHEWAAIWGAYKSVQSFPSYFTSHVLQAICSSSRVKVKKLILDRLKHDWQQPFFYPEDVRYLAKIEDVEIRIHALQQIDHVAKFLTQLPNLKRLSLMSSGTRWNEPSAYTVVLFGNELRLPKLVDINIASFPIHCSGLYDFLRNHPALRNVSLTGLTLYSNDVDSIFDPFRQISSLREFRFYGSVEYSPSEDSSPTAAIDVPRRGETEHCITEYVLGRSDDHSWTQFLTKF